MPGGGKGGSSSSVTVNNGPITVDSDSTVDINGLDHIGLKLDPISITETLRTPDPLVTKSDSTSNSNSNVVTKSDVTSDNKNALSVDLKPVVLDICSTTTTNLPHGEVLQPFDFHVGITWFGTEIFGFNFAGESKTILRDLPKRPAIDWPAQQNAASHGHGQHEHHEHHHDHNHEPSVETSPRRSEGLRIRIK